MKYVTCLKVGLLAAAMFVLASCKIAVIVVEGGEVQSNASGTCVAGMVCITEIHDSNYNDTFTAVAYPGWKFVRWNSADGSLCANLLNPSCIVNNSILKGNPGAEAVIASDTPFYLMPIFEIDDDYVEPSLKLTESSFFGSREISLPYLCTPASCSKTSNVTILGSSTVTHSTLTLTAEGKDFVVSNLTAFDSNNVTTVGFEGLQNGMTIEAGTSVEFSLVSGLTKGQLASLFWSFEVDTLGVQFSDVLNLRTN